MKSTEQIQKEIERLIAEYREQLDFVNSEIKDTKKEGLADSFGCGMYIGERDTLVKIIAELKTALQWVMEG